MDNNTFDLLSVPSGNSALVKAGLASVITLKRFKENISTEDLAMRIGCSTEDIRQLEEMDYHDITILEMFQILDKLGVKVSMTFDDIKVI